MRHFTAIFLTTALLAVPAIAQQASGPSPASATATTEELAQIRARKMAPGEPVIARVPIDPALIEISSRTPLEAGNEPQSRGGNRRTYISHFADTVEADLSARGSNATIEHDATLSLFTITGPRWEVEEAKSALQSALPAFLQRVRELEELDANIRRSRQAGREREQELRLNRSTVNISWEGGALGDLVEAIKSTVECNVVLADPTVGALVIPALSVNRVAPEVFFQSLQSIPLADDRRLAVTVIAPESKPADGKSPALETLPVVVIAERSDSRISSSDRRVFDLSGWSGADAAGIKKLIEAINFAMEANGQESLVKVRYHEPSKILFAKGPSDAVALINEIVLALQGKK